MYKEEVNIKETLEELGLSKNESRIYHTLIRLGSSNISKIVSESKVHRTNVYDALEGLRRKGLVSSVLKDKKKYFEALNPSGLINLIREKEYKLMKIIPILKKEQTVREEVARTYEGVRAFRTILTSWLDKKEAIYTYGIPRGVIYIMGVPFINQFHKKRIKKRIVMKHIYNENARERIKYLNKLPYTEARYLPSDFNTDACTILCGDEIMIVHWKKNPFIIHLKQKELADTYRKYFEFLYKKARE